LSENENKNLAAFLKPLYNHEYNEVNLSKQKGRKNYLRIYALRIENNLFVITGGAIKFTLLMEEREHTANELIKIERCRNFLRENGVMDADSFFEFLIELQ